MNITPSDSSGDLSPTSPGLSPSKTPEVADGPVPTRPVKSANRRQSSPGGAGTAYPVLLILSTALAGVFCLLYIKKPVKIYSAASSLPDSAETKPAANVSIPSSPTIATPVPAPVSAPSLLPSSAKLPGEEKAMPSPALPTPDNSSPFEETNLRIQHVLTAESPNGDINKIVLNVPVLYQSRNLRWTSSEVLEARQLLARLAQYQERSIALQSEGAALRDAWNNLVEKSLPVRDVRADSPSLPSNQLEAADPTRRETSDSPQSIQIQPTGK